MPGNLWEPVVTAAELAGSSWLVLALVFVLLPFALAGRRPGVGSVALQVGVVLALAAVGVAILRSGLSGEVVVPVGPYAVGPYDARPRWEAVSGLLVAAAGVCLLVAAVLERVGGPPCVSRGHDVGRLVGQGAAWGAGRR